MQHVIDGNIAYFNLIRTPTVSTTSTDVLTDDAHLPLPQKLRAEADKALPSKLSKRKHQINSLYHAAKMKVRDAHSQPDAAPHRLAHNRADKGRDPHMALGWACQDEIYAKGFRDVFQAAERGHSSVACRSWSSWRSAASH